MHQRTIKPFTFLLLTCIGWVSFPAHATPPTAPNISISAEGLEVNVEWAPVADATGYTLYYAGYPDAGAIQSIDLGNHFAFGRELADGEAFYISVKAYNQDGESEYS
ncbi:MAG: hypothetical protein AAF512_08820, partial [Pseudomonadota bacterium]